MTDGKRNLPFGLASAMFSLTVGCGATGGSTPDGFDASGGSVRDKASASFREAEESVALGGCTIASRRTGYTGRGYVDFGEQNSWAEWKVQVPSNGVYTLSLRYANGSSSAREGVVSVHGKESRVRFAATGAWETWGTTEVGVTLRAGVNAIRVTASTSLGGPNLDSLQVGGGDGAGGSGGYGGGGLGAISVVATTGTYEFDGQGLRIARPSGVRSGDLLVLALHRTDDTLPLAVPGWTRVAECYKTDNGYQCATASDCTSWSSDRRFCGRFRSGAGQDLAQAIFVRAASNNEPAGYQFDLNQDGSGHPGWALLTALRGANTSNPVRAWSNKGCDGKAASAFPSVSAQRGDYLLMSQSFDDDASRNQFTPPPGSKLLGFINGERGPAPDEAGYLFGRTLGSSGATGTLATGGRGGPGGQACKDGLVTLAIRPR